MNIRIFGLENDSIVDGPGIRYAIFTQGCPHNCEGCHNPDSHDINGGYIEDADAIIEKIMKNPLLDGVTFSGGEPFMQADALSYIAQRVHEKGLDVITYTGFTWEEIIENANEENGFLKLLKNIDVLVDGRFIKSERSLDLEFKGSKNQRIINVQDSLKSGKIQIHHFE